MKLIILLIIHLFFSFDIAVSQINTDNSAGPDAVWQSISPDSIEKHVEILGNDTMAGRGTGSPGEKLASQYIADRFASYDLIPVGDDGTYYQNIPMHGSVPLADSRLRIFYENGLIHDFELNTDYVLDKSGAQTFVPNPLPLVFVGYGIVAPEFNYNDYQTVDVNGKIVVFLEGEPVSNDSAYFDGISRTIYSLTESKHRLAISRGAVGSILITDFKTPHHKNWENFKTEYSFENITLSYSVSSQLSIILNPDAASYLFKHSEFQFNEISRMALNHKLKSFYLPNRLSFRGQFIERNFTSQNVIALLEGHDKTLKDSYVLLSAHYDHLGTGPVIKGDSIYNGVIDNASGVAGLLELARVFSQFSGLNKRSLIFLATTGEEKGLLGANYYIDHPRYPLHKTVANINIDGLALFDDFQDIMGIGAELSSMANFLVKSLKRFSLSYTEKPVHFEIKESFWRSDQIAFAYGGIPSLLIMEGLNWRNYTPEAALDKIIWWMDNIYHSPFDDFSQKLNFGAAEKHLQIICYTTFSLLNSQNTPQWNKGVEFRNIRLQTIAEKR